MGLELFCTQFQLQKTTEYNLVKLFVFKYVLCPSYHACFFLEIFCSIGTTESLVKIYIVF
jgi:hypothetical protein